MSVRLLSVALLAAFLWSYWPTLGRVVHEWNRQPDYSHGYLVVPIALAFLWYRRVSYPSGPPAPSLVGAAMLLGVIVTRVFAAIFYLEPLDAWTIPLWVGGAVWMLMGRAVFLWCLPAILFLFFMFPIPYSAERWLSVPLQSFATKFSAAGLLMLGQPALTEGNTIWLGEHQLFVADACSGLRIFVGIFAVAFAYVLFVRHPWWMKVMVLVAALPVAIAANVLRIIVTALLYQHASSETAHRFSHDLAGVAMIPLAAALFALFVTYLQRLLPEVEALSAADLHRQMFDRPNGG